MQTWVVAVVVAGFALAGPSPASTSLVCAEQPSVLQCDADRDGIVDVVEEAICGSATCATGTEDYDGNGVADAEELAESLTTGGPGGPLQSAGPDAVILVSPDGTILEFSLWPVAGVATILLAGLTAFVVVRRRSRFTSVRTRTKELV